MKFTPTLYSGACALAVVTLTLGMPLPASADTEALSERLRAVETAVNGDDAQGWADAMYAEQVIVTGEGTEEVVRSRAELMPVLEAIVGDTQSCTIEMNDAQANESMAYSFATWTCQPAQADAPEFQVRALYVWEQQSPGWRVVAEMYGMGSM